MEAVTESEVGVDELLSRERFLELGAQLTDVDVDRPLLLAERPGPDHRVQLLATDDPAAPARERGEQAQLPHGQRQRAPVRERDVLAGPDLQLTLPQDLVSSRFHSKDELRGKGRKVRYEGVTVL